jgi:hypothetical protein
LRARADHANRARHQHDLSQVSPILQLHQMSRAPNPVLDVTFASNPTVPGLQLFARLPGEPVTIERHRAVRQSRCHVARIMPAKSGVLARPSLMQNRVICRR